MKIRGLLLAAILVLCGLPEADAQGCQETFCQKKRASTGVCDIPAIDGCSCACDDPL
jgi:hypothetical protein